MENAQPTKAIELFEQMKKNGLLEERPTATNADQIKSVHIIHLCAINGLAQLGMASIARSISRDLPTSLLSNILIQNALIDMWVRRERDRDPFDSFHSIQGKVGCVDKAKGVFEQIPRPDRFGYTSMSLFPFPCISVGLNVFTGSSFLWSEWNGR